ncbi:sulfate transporter family-domain-containing protein [Hyaloraphidium curvatum]|nr:sulfate transporter family-domain-containing protein [Hyaloraphidium curvatum]
MPAGPGRDPDSPALDYGDKLRRAYRGPGEGEGGSAEADVEAGDAETHVESRRIALEEMRRTPLPAPWHAAPDADPTHAPPDLRRKRPAAPGAPISARLSRALGRLYWPSLPFAPSWPRQGAGRELLASAPGIVVALILNSLEAITFGALVLPQDLYPGDGAPNLVVLGVFLFYFSQFTCQAAMTLLSGFKGAVGTQVLEILPSMLLMSEIVAGYEGGKLRGPAAVATVLFAYCLVTIMSAVSFFLLGLFRAGFLVSLFPLHVLTGVIGGIGLYLVRTAFEITSGISPLTFSDVPALFTAGKALVWGPALGAALVLFALARFIKWYGLTATYYVFLLVIFYVVVAATRADFADLRAQGWLYDLPPSDGMQANPFAPYYAIWDFGLVDAGALGALVPTLFAATFFSLLQVPINVPAVAFSARTPVDFDREIHAHAVSNLVSAAAGGMPTNMTFVASAALYESGGGRTRLTGLAILAADAAMLWLGPAAAYGAPTFVVGAVNFYIGLGLLRDALVGTLGNVTALEYLTILVLVLVMGLVDFTTGIAVGLGMACVTFAVWQGRKDPVRAVHSVRRARSSVARPAAHRRVLDREGWRVGVARMQGALFFGNLPALDRLVGTVVAGEWAVEVLVVDLERASGIDYSFCAGLAAARDSLASVGCKLLVAAASPRARAKLERANAVAASPGAFASLDLALEHAENEVIERFCREGRGDDQRGGQRGAVGDGEGMPEDAGTPDDAESPDQGQPARILREAVRSAGEELSPAEAASIAASFRREELAAGSPLFSPGEPADRLWILESGCLDAWVELDCGRGRCTVSTLLPGCFVGELEFLGRYRRFVTVVANEDSVLWSLDAEGLQELGRRDGELCWRFARCAFGVSAMREDDDLNRWLMVLT